MEKIIIVGLSTNARHAYEFIKNYGLYDVVGFAVNEKYYSATTFKGLPVYKLEELEKHYAKDSVKLFIALLWNHLNADRKNLFEVLSSNGWTFANLISPHAKIRGSIEGSNVWIHDDVIVQNDTVIKDNVAVMAMSLIGGDCIIESHCFLGAKSTVGGGSVVGEQSFIGINCTIFDNIIIGKKCILGACTAVKRNVPDYSLFKTSSDFEIKQFSEAEIENKLIYTMNKR